MSNKNQEVLLAKSACGAKLYIDRLCHITAVPNEWYYTLAELLEDGHYEITPEEIRKALIKAMEYFAAEKNTSEVNVLITEKTSFQLDNIAKGKLILKSTEENNSFTWGLLSLVTRNGLTVYCRGRLYEKNTDGIPSSYWAVSPSNIVSLSSFNSISDMMSYLRFPNWEATKDYYISLLNVELKNN